MSSVDDEMEIHINSILNLQMITNQLRVITVRIKLLLIGKRIHENMISNNLTIVPNLVESLPLGHNYGGVRAVSTPKGPIILLSSDLFLLVCNGNTCSWQKQSQQLDHSARHSVMMVLPDGYSC